MLSASLALWECRQVEAGQEPRSVAEAVAIISGGGSGHLGICGGVCVTQLFYLVVPENLDELLGSRV